MKTIRDYLDTAAANTPERIAQRFYEGNRIVARSYAALCERVVNAAAIVQHLNIRPGEQQVALMLENSPEWQEIYLALAGAGVAVVPIDPKLRASETLHILRDSESVAIFAGNRLRELLAGIADELPQLRACVWVGNGDSLAGEMKACATYVYESLLEHLGKACDAARDWYDNHKPSLDSIASILYTSGTTGQPKGAMLSHANFTSNAAASIRKVGFYPSDNFLNILPLFHSFSFTANFMLPLSLGGCCSFVRSIRTISDDMRTLRPTIMLAVPLLAEKLYSRISEQLQRNRMARLLTAVGLRPLVLHKVRQGFGGRLRLIGIGGAPTAHETLYGFQRLGIPVLEGYGLTECSPGVAYPHLSNYKVGTVGEVLDNLDYKLIDPDETGAGELCVRGPSVMRGYYKNPAATAEAIDAEGYFHTGDLARFDANGTLTICGRRKALIINREGKNIYPEEIEQLIERSPFVQDVVVLGYKQKDTIGERVGAIIVPDCDALTLHQSQAVAARWGEAVALRWREAVAARAKKRHDSAGNSAPPQRSTPLWTEEQTIEFLRREIMQLCHAHLADYKLPRKIDFRRTPLERTSTMKVRRVTYAGTLDE